MSERANVRIVVNNTTSDPLKSLNAQLKLMTCELHNDVLRARNTMNFCDWRDRWLLHHSGIPQDRDLFATKGKTHE